MRARQPKYPGRIKLTFEDGSVKFATLERADEPLVAGDPLNPYTLLKDETCTMLGGDPETMVPDDALQVLAALACSGGGSGDSGELEDYTIEVGTFKNTAAGWNTYKFREPFEGVPVVILQVEDFAGVAQIKTVTKDGFLYCLRTMADATTATAVTVHYTAIEYGGER